MAKMSHFITVFITAPSVLSAMLVIGQAFTDTHQSSTASTSTYSAPATKSPRIVTSNSPSTEAADKTDKSAATSSPLTATFSDPYTVSRGKLTSTDQTNTAVTSSSGSLLLSTEETNATAASEITTDQFNRDSDATNNSGTTQLQSTELFSGKTITPPREELGSTTPSTGIVRTSPQSASGNKKEDSLAMNPGLVAILCIFFIVVTLVLVVAIAKIISYARKPQFERLEDLPLNKMNEYSRFAQYSPK